MRILILEDEPLVAESLLKILQRLEPEAIIEGPVTNVKDARARLCGNDLPDLILADIQLADGISIDVFTEGNIKCPVIFTTAYNEYAIRAFKVNSIDYLLKPIDKSELRAALDKYYLLQSKFTNSQYVAQLGQLFGNFQNSRRYKERFTVNAGRNVVLVPVSDVVCFSKEEVICLHHTEGRKFITDFRSLDEIEELLDPAKFFRANRQFIIHLDAITSMRSEESGKVIVKMHGPSCGEIVISKEKAAQFRKWVEGM
jgi:DNA-binding LytR/AlgR family response regulator